MRASACFGLCCLLSACIYRESVGAFDEVESSCEDPALASTPEETRACIVELIDDLSSGRWVGKARSGEVVADCMVEFGRDGSFRLTNVGDVDAFRALFVPATHQFEGRYTFSDLLEGEFYGTFELQTDNGTFRTGLEGLTVTGDQLTFWWRTLTSDFALVTSQLTLTRQR